MNFQNITNVLIPEGNVNKIFSSNKQILWEKPLLPFAYQYVDYISFNKDSYIDSGIIPTDDTMVIMKISTPLTSHNGRTTFGSRTNAQSEDRFCLFYGDYDGTVYCDWQFGSEKVTTDLSEYVGNDVPVVLKFSKNGFYVDDLKVIDTFTNTLGETQYSMFIGSINQLGSAMGMFKGNIYSVQFYRSNIMIADFRSCYRKSDGVYGMYDLVNDKFSIKIIVDNELISE